MNHTADVEIFASARRVRSCQIFAQHVGDGYSHFMAGARISNHGADLVDLPVQRMDVSDGHGLFTRPEPGFCQNSLPYPTSEGDIVKPEAQHSGVHREMRFGTQLGNKLSPLAVFLK